MLLFNNIYITYFLFICGILAIFDFIFSLWKKFKNNSSSKESNYYFTCKNFLTNSEFSFYKKMLPLQEKGYIIIPQLNLASIIEKHNSNFRNELFRNIDFAIFDQNFNLLLLIELNDSSHQRSDRKNRDLKVKKILNDCHIKLLTFYTTYPNETTYVVNRILNAIESPLKDEITK